LYVRSAKPSQSIPSSRTLGYRLIIWHLKATSKVEYLIKGTNFLHDGRTEKGVWRLGWMTSLIQTNDIASMYHSLADIMIATLPLWFIVLSTVCALPTAQVLDERQSADYHWVDTWTSMPQQVEQDNLPPSPFVCLLHLGRISLTILIAASERFQRHISRLHSSPNFPHVYRGSTLTNSNLQHLRGIRSAHNIRFHKRTQ
jgi:hypothetical protein